jgi:hypothetical protein
MSGELWGAIAAALLIVIGHSGGAAGVCQRVLALLLWVVTVSIFAASNAGRIPCAVYLCANLKQRICLRFDK